VTSRVHQDDIFSIQNEARPQAVLLRPDTVPVACKIQTNEQSRLVYTPTYTGLGVIITAQAYGQLVSCSQIICYFGHMYSSP